MKTLTFTHSPAQNQNWRRRVGPGRQPLRSHVGDDSRRLRGALPRYSPTHARHRIPCHVGLAGQHHQRSARLGVALASMWGRFNRRFFLLDFVTILT